MDKINQKLDEFKEMTPDSNFTVEGDTGLIDGFINEYSDFFNNIVSDIESLKNSFSEVNDLLKQDNYSLSSLDSEIVSCPITSEIYGNDFSVDFCSFISPYRPLMQVFFTVVFNLLVIKFFLKLVIYKEDK